jgi:hypothetical protein
MANGFALTLDMSSIRNLEAQLLRKLQQGQIEGGLSIKMQAEEIMADSYMQTPEDTGTLARSGFVEATGTGSDTTVRIGYDGTRVNPKAGKTVSSYIMQVHERLDKFHPKGNAKFFEGPVLQYIPRFEPTIAAAMRKALLR